MGSEILEKVKATSIYPDHLMGGITQSIMVKALAVSLAAHVAIIALTSIGFVRLCLKYDSWHPKEEQRRQEEEQRQAEMDQKRQERLTAAGKSVAETEDSTSGETGVKPDPPPSDGTDSGDTGEIPIEQELEEVDTGRPELPKATFDDVNDLQ